MPGASFCASCGGAVAAPPVEQQPAQAGTGWAPAAPPVAQPAPVPPAHSTQQQPVAGAWTPTAPGAPQQFPAAPWGAQATGAPSQPAAAPWGAQATGAPSQPAAAPWGAQATGAPQHPSVPWGTPPAGAPQQPAAPRRNLVDALLTGDWGGAARAGGLGVAAMLAVSLVGVLLATGGGVGFRETVALVFAAVCLAVGGDAFTESGVDSFTTSASAGLLPLTVTFAGLGVLAWQSVRQLRRGAGATSSDALLQGVRTALVFTACFLPLALFTRYDAEGEFFDVTGVLGRVGVGVLSTVIGALLFAVATLGLTWLFSRATVLSGRFGVIRDAARAPLVGALAVFVVGVLAVLVALVYALVEGDEPALTLGVTVLAAGNGALASVLLAAGVPLNAEGGATGGPLGEIAPSGSQKVDLFTFTDASAWSWLAPVVLLAATVLVAVALAVRQNTVEDARREGVRFAGALAVVAFAAGLLLRIAFDTEAGEFSVEGGASVTFNPLMAAFVLGLWGLVTGLLAPVVAAKVPSGFVLGVRRRFGAAPQPAQPPVA
ncbi:streptophobe family protein [Geodermatophilus sp. SYSU D01180]